MKKRILSCIMALAMVLTMLPSAALAAEPPEEEDKAGIVQGAEATYTSIAAALEAGEDSVTLTGNLQEDVVVGEGEQLTLNLGGHELSEASSHTISNKGTLVIEGTGTVKNTIAGVGALANYPSGKVTLNGGTFENTGWYTIKNLGTMTINEGVEVNTTDAGSSLIDTGWYGNTGNDLGLDYTQAGTVTLTINGGTFTGGMNTIKNDDYGVLLIKDGTFQNEQGAVVLNWNEATIEGGSFTGKAGSSPVIANSYLNSTADKGQLIIIGGTFTAPENSALFGCAEGNKTGGTTTVEGGTFNGSIGSGLPYELDITGGTYDDVDGVEAYLPDGYTANESGQVVPATEAGENSIASVMQNGTTQYFETLSGAIDAAGIGDTVTLLKEIQVEEVISIPEDKDFVLNLGGYTLTLSDTEQVTDEQSGFSSSAALINHGTVVIENGTISFSGTSSHGIVNTGNLTVASGATISGTATEYSNTSVIANIGGTLTTEGALESTANHGIVTYGGTVEVTGGEITAKYTSEDGRNRGSGILIFNRGYDNESAGADVTIFGGTIDCSIYGVSTNNTTSGGTDGSDLTITGGTILSEFTAIYWPSSGTLTIGTDGGTSGPIITSTKGSAVEICSGTLNVYGGTLNGGTEMTESDQIKTTEDWVEAFRSSSGSSSIGDAVTVISRRGNGYNSAALEVNIAGGTFTSGQNYGLRYMDCNQTENAAQITQTVSVSVSDGNFSGKIAAVDAAFVAEEDQVFISGGTFSDDVSSYVVEGAVWDENTHEIVVDTTVDAVAIIGNVAYDDLVEALSAAKTGDTVTLKKNVDLTVPVTISEGITFDLGGNTLTLKRNTSSTSALGLDFTSSGDSVLRNGMIIDERSKGNQNCGFIAVRLTGDGTLTTENLTVQTYQPDSEANYNYLLRVDGGTGTLTLETGTVLEEVKQDNPTSEITYGAIGVAIFGTQTTNTTEFNSTTNLIIEDGARITTTGFAISGNGSNSNGTNITIHGGEITSLSAQGIYHPQYGTLTIDGGTVTGVTGIEMRSGELNVSGDAVVVGTGEPSSDPNSSGSTTSGAGIAVVQHTTKLPIEVMITGGEISGYNALYQENTQDNDDEAVGKISIDVKGGDFLATGGDGAPVYSENKQGFISGGNFSDPVGEEYLSDDLNAELYSISRNPDAPYSYYSSVEAAEDVAQPGDVIRDLTETEVETYTVTLKFNNGSADETSTVSSGTYLVLPSPTRSGYRFVNWSDGSKSYGAGESVEITDNVTFSASWDRISGGGSGGGSSSSSSGDYLISVDKTTGGTVRVNPGRADRGDTVTITVKPNSGYELDELVVTDKNGDTIRLTDKGNDKYTFKMPGSKVTVEATFVRISEEPEALPFVDVPTGAYYYDAVAWAVENGVTNGTSATTFGPDVTCTRAQMVTFLWRAAGSPEPETTVNPFTDVSESAYYYEAVLWAVERGITNGTSATTFSPDATVTRGQTVTFLWRDTGSPAAAGTAFTDVAVDAYYTAAVSWAANEGITSGTSATTFSPDNACTRAQIVTFLYRAQ